MVLFRVIDLSPIGNFINFQILLQWPNMDISTEVQGQTRREMRATEREQRIREFQQRNKSKSYRRWMLWGGTVLVLIGIVIGLVKVVRSVPGSGAGAVLAVPVTTSDWTIGAQNPQLTLVEYADFQCPGCGAYHPLLQQLLKDYTGKLRLVYRNFPLTQIHNNATYAARAVGAAGVQGQFWPMHDLVFEHQQDWAESPKPEAVFTQYAQSLKLNVDQWKRDIDSGVVKDKVDKDYQSGIQAGVDSTPTFFLNNKKIAPSSYEDFKSILNAAMTSPTP